MERITADQIKSRLDRGDGLILVEALPEKSFREGHLPGAKNVPVDENFEARIRQAVPDTSAEVAVYCANTECPASEEAAGKMEALGYENVYEYVEGKEGWQEAGLPLEG
jgi:rhodanese-related sulfurtransferase